MLELVPLRIQAGEMAQLAQCLPCEREDSALTLQNPCEKPGCDEAYL